MITRWSVPLAALALALGSAAYAAPAMAATPAPHAATSAELAAALNPGGLFKAAPGVRHALVDGKVLSYSSNWSGYAITGSTFTTTTASWTQPTITCTSGDKACCAMIQACCDCMCGMMKAGCTCCVMMNGMPVCCGC